MPPLGFVTFAKRQIRSHPGIRVSQIDKLWREHRGRRLASRSRRPLRRVGSSWFSDIADSWKQGIKTAIQIAPMVGLGRRRRYRRRGGSFMSFLKLLPVPYTIARLGQRLVTGSARRRIRR